MGAFGSLSGLPTVLLVLLALNANFTRSFATEVSNGLPTTPGHSGIAATVNGEIDTVVVVGVDGLSTSYYRDLLRNGQLPNFARLRSRSAYTDSARAVMPSVSYTNWQSILTSSDPSFHGVDGNDYKRAHSPVVPVTGLCSFYPNLFSVLRVPFPRSFLSARYSWPVISEVLEPRRYLNQSESEMSDESVVDGCVKDLQGVGRRRAERLAKGLTGKGVDGEAVAALLCYMVKVDEIGHVYGFGQDYVDAIVETDVLLGRLLDTLETTGLMSSTLIVLVSDHGRAPDSGHEHGAFTTEEIETPWSITGPGIKRGMLRTPIHTYDTASTIVSALGVEPPLQWHGRMVWEAFRGEISDRPVVGSSEVGPSAKRAGWLYQEAMNPDLECVEELALLKETRKVVEEPETSILPAIFGGGPEKPKPKSRHVDGTCGKSKNRPGYHPGHGFAADPHSLHLQHGQFHHDHLSHAHHHHRANLTRHELLYNSMAAPVRWFRAVRLGISKVILRVVTSAGDGRFHFVSFVLGIVSTITTLLLFGSSVGCGMLICRVRRRRLGSGAGETPHFGPVEVSPLNDSKPYFTSGFNLGLRKSMSTATLMDEIKLPSPGHSTLEPAVPIVRPKSSPPRAFVSSQLSPRLRPVSRGGSDTDSSIETATEEETSRGTGRLQL